MDFIFSLFLFLGRVLD